MAPSTAFCFTLVGVGLIAHLLKAALRWTPRVVASVMLAVARAKYRSKPSRATLAFWPRNFLTVSSATFASFPNANHLMTMFALWEWKCSIPVELLALAGVRGGRTAELVLARAAAISSWGAVTT